MVRQNSSVRSEQKRILMLGRSNISDVFPTSDSEEGPTSKYDSFDGLHFTQFRYRI